MAALSSYLDEWNDLAGRALEPNLFYEPAFARPAVAAFGAQAEAILIWSGHERRRLIGLFPHRIEPRRYGAGPAVLVGWTHPFAPLGTPLIDRDEAAAAISTWLDTIAGEPTLPNVALLPFVPDAGPFARALQLILAQRGGAVTRFDAHARALLAPGTDRGGYLKGALAAKKRKELRRQRRRLADGAAVAVSAAADPASVAAALEQFLALEAEGWKGAAGTAAARNPAVAAFMREAMSGLAARNQVRIDRLLRDGKPVAAAIILRSAAAAWFWKIAYDEQAARASPGVQLALELTRSALADASLISMDSCATPDHPMIERLWRERLAIADLMISPGGADKRYACAGVLEHARRGLLATAKRLRRRLRGR